MDSEFVKFFIPVIATIFSPIIIFMITRAANKENDKMAIFNARVDFLRKLIELQDKYEALENTGVKVLLKHEIDFFYNDIIPVLKEESVTRDATNRALMEYKKKSKFRKILLFYRQASLRGVLLQISYYLVGTMFFSFTYSMKFEFAAGEVIDMNLLMLIVFGYLFGIFSIMYLINYFSKRVWISTFEAKAE